MSILLTNKDLKNLGVTPVLLKALLRRGGVGAVRAVVASLKRAVAKVLHPDALGGKQDATYRDFLSAVEVFDGMADKDLEKSLDEYKSRATKQEEAPVVLVRTNVLSDLVVLCSKGGSHVLSLRPTVYVRSVSFSEDRKVYAIEQTLSGIRFKTGKAIPDGSGGTRFETSDGDWQMEDGVFIVGSFGQGFDGLLKKTVYRQTTRLLAGNLPGKQVGTSPIKRTLVPAVVIPRVEEFYTPKLLEPNHLALVDSAGALWTLGRVCCEEK